MVEVEEGGGGVRKRGRKRRGNRGKRGERGRMKKKGWK